MRLCHKLYQIVFVGLVNSFWYVKEKCECEKCIKEDMYRLNSSIVIFKEYVRVKKFKATILLDRAQSNHHNTSLNIFCWTQKVENEVLVMQCFLWLDFCTDTAIRMKVSPFDFEKLGYIPKL